VGRGSLAAMTADANTWRPPASAAPVRATGRGAADRVTKAPEGLGQAGLDHASRYRRRRNGLLARVGQRRGVLDRYPHYVWATIVLVMVYTLALFSVYRTIGSGVIQEVAAVTQDAYGQPTILTWAQVNEAYGIVIRPAALTLLAYVVLFVLIDRLRPTTWTMKLLALGWGACMAVLVSLHLNTWAGELMRAEGPVDAAQGTRAAIFSAPFVEEAAKATILFFLAILMRRRMVGVHQVFTLAGLSAVGFAFTENVVYYLRTFLYASTIYQVDPDQELSSIVSLRGVVLSFGHPLFTSMTALGMTVAIVNRSKLVRVLAPAAGYLTAAFGHMAFNGLSSMSDSIAPLLIGGWVAVAAILVYLGFRYVHQVRTIGARLSEFVQAGWLTPDDPKVFSSFFGRWRLTLAASLRGPRVLANTLRLQRDLTELAYVRDAELRGTIDAMAVERERELILDVDAARVWGLDRNEGLRIVPPEWGQRWAAFREHRRQVRTARREKNGQWAPPPQSATPVGAGNWPAPTS